jgi:hypothetical protein
MNALDLENATSCWNSDGSPSGKHSNEYTLNFGRMVEPTELRIQFQAGFVGEELQVFWQDGSAWKSLVEAEVDDDHDVQIFSLLETSSGIQTKALKLVFDECTDFYGRVTVYRLEVRGFEVLAELEGQQDSGSAKSEN